jgi:putative membrane protein
MSLGALLAMLLGTAMIVAAPALLAAPWMRVKLPLVALLIVYHAWCYRLMITLRAGGAGHSQRWYRWFNEIPGVLLVAIVVVAVLKP